MVKLVEQLFKTIITFEFNIAEIIWVVLVWLSILLFKVKCVDYEYSIWSVHSVIFILGLILIYRYKRFKNIE